MCETSSSPQSPRTAPSSKQYDYLLKFLLVGDSDVGKEELLSGMEDGASESPYGYSSSGMYTIITGNTNNTNKINQNNENILPSSYYETM